MEPTEYKGELVDLIREMRDEGVIYRLAREEVRWLSPVFAIPKRDGTFRVIVDYRNLNEHLQAVHFKMESARTVADLLEEGDFAVTLDLHKAYYLIPMGRQARPFLAFSHGKDFWSFRGMPFGLSQAPRCFTQIMRRVIKRIRSRWKVKASFYLDDIIILHRDPDRLKEIVHEVVSWMEALGFLFNLEKCVVEPVQEFVFLGWSFNTRTMKARIEEGKARKLRRLIIVWILRVLAGERASGRQLASLVGKISATRMLYRDCSLQCARLFRALKQLVREKGWSRPGRTRKDALYDLKVWALRLRANEWRNFQPGGLPDGTLTTDASPDGMGATWRTGDRCFHFCKKFGAREREQTSNFRELLAVEKAFDHFLPLFRRERVHRLRLRSDSMVVVFIMNRGRSGPNLRALAKRIFAKLELAGMELSAEHVPGSKNSTADSLSRLERSGDYSIRREKLDEVMRWFQFPVTLDAFATATNAKVPRWCGPGSQLAEDGLEFPWKNEQVLAHPPIPLILQTLRKIEREGAQTLLLLPGWRGQVWEKDLERLETGKVIFPSSAEVLEEGRWMIARQTKLPPGPYLAVLIRPQRRLERSGPSTF